MRTLRRAEGSGPFYGTAIDVPAWNYDGVRCINCGSITALMRGEREVRTRPIGSGQAGWASSMR